MSPAASNRRTAMTLVLMGALAAVAFATAFYRTTDWTTPLPRDATTLAAGRDFLNFWMAGRAAQAPDPGRYYDPVMYNHALATVAGAAYPTQTWSYPPTQLLIAAPFGLLSYRLALALWTLLGVAVLYLTARRMLGARPALFVFAAPAALFCLMSGQSSFFTTALLISGFLLLERRPWIAGVLIGLLSLKPQLVLLMPVVLIAGRHWRALAGAAATSLALMMATTALYGLDVWRDYIAFGLPAQNAVMANTQVLATQTMPTVYMNLHRIGLSYGAAMAVQGLFALGAAVAVWRSTRAAWPTAHKAAVFVAASVAATPYLMPYDALPLALTGLWLLADDDCGGRGRVMVKLVWWLPFIQMALGALSVPGAALIPPALVLWLMLRHGATRAPVSEPATASAVN